MAVKTGSFQKTATTGSNVTQGVAHGLGETPKALILWTTCETTGSGIRSDAFVSLGFVDQDRSALAFATASDHDAAASATARRIAGAAISVINHADASVISEAEISAWDATNFTVHWTTQGSSAQWVIGFMAISGASVQSKVIDHLLDGDTGSDPITGAGFQPDAALFANIGNVTGTPLPQGSGTAALSFGATDGTAQWAVAYEANDGADVANTRRGQRTDSCFIALSTVDDFTWVAAISSMDADGLTLNVSTAGSAGAHLGVLFLKGVDVAIGSFDKTTSAAPASNSVSGLAFDPEAIILASFQSTSTASVIGDAHMGIGFSDGSGEAASGLVDSDARFTTNTGAYSSNTKAFLVVDNSAATTDAEADATMESGGFDVDWTTNDAVATQILYLAIRTQAEFDPALIQARQVGATQPYIVPAIVIGY